MGRDWRKGVVGPALRHGHAGAAGMGNSITYRSWNSMMGRCYRPTVNGYDRYGAVGIKVCERWHTFANFLADMGNRPDAGYTIHRIKSEIGYEPGNCRWATKKEQQRESSNAVSLKAFGRTQCLAAWSEEFGLSVQVLRYRLKRYVNAEAALTAPIMSGRGKRKAV